MIRSLGLLALLAALVTAPASAQAPSRPVAIPESAVRGTMSHVSQNVVTVDGQTMQLSPGARIWNRENLAITPAMLPKESLVDYVVDGNRQIFRGWILTPAEAAIPRKGSGYGEIGTSIDRLFGPPPVPSGYGPPPAPRKP